MTWSRPARFAVLGAGALLLYAGAPRALAALGASPEIPLPVGSYRVSSPYGPRTDPVYDTPAFHAGVDLAAPTGTPVYAAVSGRISRIDRLSPVNGNAVFVEGEDGRRWCYLHLNTIEVTLGDHIARGVRLGTVGSTGKATGPHLHLQVYAPSGDTVDPETLYPAGL